jgi:LmbE family N-acetylglucosaminyl deacetylase
LLVSREVAPQERGAIALGEAVMGLGVNTRVLVIGAHPDDEDTFLISWLSRGRHVETAYLSLTRGDGGQNLIGNELGEALGVIRTEELLAARRVDGARQYFTRAYDFGFSKDTIDTYKHWPRDSILADVVRVVRAFRPHVIVAVFSGTPRDGHGHHQVSGLLARTVYDIGHDTKRFPVAEYGLSWTPLKFYRAARFNPDAATLRFDVGEYSPLLGRSYAEIAGESRSQHKSQGFGAPQRKGPIFDYLRREASRVNESTVVETSIFDGIDTTWTRFRDRVARSERAGIDSLPVAIAAARAAYDPLAPAKLIAPLARVRRVLELIESDNVPGTGGRSTDLESALQITEERLGRALRLASSLEMEAFAQREIYPAGRTTRVVASTYNRGSDTAVVRKSVAGDGSSTREIAMVPASMFDAAVEVRIDAIGQPYWLRTPRVGAMFTQPISLRSETELAESPFVTSAARIARIARSWLDIGLREPVVFRAVDPVKGEIRRPVVGAPAVAVTLDHQVQYVPATVDFNRTIEVHLRSADDKPRDVRVTIGLPKGLTADSVTRTTRLERYDAQQTITFRIRGRLPVGQHRIAALAESEGETFSTGYDLIDFDHIRRQRIYRPAAIELSAVDVRIPANLKVAYITGVSDNVAPALAHLGIPVTIVPAGEVARADLHAYTTVVVGPRAYEAHPELVAANARLFEFARKGGTLVVQYGQTEMMQPGIMPYPIILARPADRVTDQDSPVTIDAPSARELTSPNRIGATDFAGWVQERALYMPRTFDPRYRSLLSMNDTGEPPNRGAVLVAPLGDGMYVYTTISFFRQLPAGVPGGARLFVNLLSAGITSPRIHP